MIASLIVLGYVLLASAFAGLFTKHKNILGNVLHIEGSAPNIGIFLGIIWPMTIGMYLLVVAVIALDIVIFVNLEKGAVSTYRFVKSKDFVVSLLTFPVTGPYRLFMPREKPAELPSAKVVKEAA